MDAVLPIAEGADLIPARIIKKLETADLVLCDISTHNPNVFFELGVRTALNKPTCYVKDNLTDRIPFDTNALNHYTYDSSLAGWTIQNDIEELSQHIVTSVSGSDGKNSLWKYFGLTTTGQPVQGSPEERQDLIMSELMAIGSRLDQMDASVPGTRIGSYSRRKTKNDLEHVILRDALLDTFFALNKKISNPKIGELGSERSELIENRASIMGILLREFNLEYKPSHESFIDLTTLNPKRN